MAVMIKDIKMPDSCGGCFMRHYDCCYATKKHKSIPMIALETKERASFCPLVEVKL